MNAGGATLWMGHVDANALWQLFVHFTMLSLIAVGGALNTAPDMQRFVVGEKGWLTDAAFTSSVAIAQSAPGPNVLFVAVIGWNVGGVAGLLAAMVGSLLPSTTLTLAAMRYGERNHDSLGVRAFTAGLAPLTVGLLLSTSWVLAQPSRHYLGMPVLFAITLAMMLLTKMSPMWPMALGALAGAMGLLG